MHVPIQGVAKVDNLEYWTFLKVLRTYKRFCKVKHIPLLLYTGLKGLKSHRPSKSWICLFYLYNAGNFYSVLQRTASPCLLRSLQSNVLIIFILTHAPSGAPGCGGKSVHTEKSQHNMKST